MKIIDIAICIDNFDPAGLGAIRCVRYSSWVGQQERALDYTKWGDSDLFLAFPFLPTNINFIPEKGQCVKIINYNPDKETINTEYIAGPFTTMFDYNSQTHSAQVENTTYGIGVKHGPAVMESEKENAYKNSKSIGSLVVLKTLLFFSTLAFVVTITSPFGTKKLQILTASVTKPPGFPLKSKIILSAP
jgi:hypothetical protein